MAHPIYGGGATRNRKVRPPHFDKEMRGREFSEGKHRKMGRFLGCFFAYVGSVFQNFRALRAQLVIYDHTSLTSVSIPLCRRHKRVKTAKRSVFGKMPKISRTGLPEIEKNGGGHALPPHFAKPHMKH